VLKQGDTLMEFKHWATFRKKSFLTQTIKDVQGSSKFKWIFSNGVGA
jgi:hypothetical protein